MNAVKTILICIIFNLYSTLSAQNIIVGGGTTISTYFGDLSPQNFKQSWSKINPGISLYASKRLWKSLYIEVDFDQSTVAGDDKSSSDISRKSRNLNFKSSITGISSLLGIRLAMLKNNKVGMTGAVGLNAFKFDPKTKLDGQYVRLQPLGTEGQGIDGSGKVMYNLIQSSKVVQLGFYYRLKESLFIELELTQYFTSTDYLDDVSGTYYDAEQIRRFHGDIAWKLADRHAEIESGSPNYPSGQTRGNPKRNDQYSYLKLGIALGIQSQNARTKAKYSKVRCPIF